MNSTSIKANPITSVGGVLALVGAAFNLYTLVKTGAPITPDAYAPFLAMFGAGISGLAATDASSK